MGVPVLSTGDANSIASATGAQVRHVRGELARTDRGCLMWRSVGPDAESSGAWIIWPEGTKETQNGDGAVLASGETFFEGSAMEADSLLVAVADLPLGTESQSYFGSFSQYCDADEHQALVLTAVGAK